MGAINFYLKKPEPIGGKSLIFLQWKYRGMRLVFSTGESIDPKQWNAKKQEVKNNSQTVSNGNYFLNDLLRNLKAECEAAYKREIKNGVPTPAILKAHLAAYMNKHIDAESHQKITLWNLIDKFISGEIRDKKQKKKTAGTLKHYQTIKNHLEGFDTKHKYKLSFEKIKQDLKEVIILTRGLKTIWLHHGRKAKTWHYHAERSTSFINMIFQKMQSWTG